jgi:hypothetical protein
VGFIGMGLRLDLILVKLAISGFILDLKLKCTRRALCFFTSTKDNILSSVFFEDFVM